MSKIRWYEAMLQGMVVSSFTGLLGITFQDWQWWPIMVVANGVMTLGRSMYLAGREE